jgi:predicted PurR-regulated permease PerM
MQFTSTQKRTAAWSAIALVATLVLLALGPVVTPFAVAAVLAYALTPVVNRMDAWGGSRMPRVAAVVIVEVLFILLALGLMLLIVPILAKEIPLMREQAPVLVDKLTVWLQPLLTQFGVQVSLDFSSIKALLLEYLNANFSDAAGSLLSSLKLGGSVALTVIGNAVLIPVALFYLLMDWSRVVGLVMELVPKRARASVNSFTTEADSVLGQYLRGQFLVMIIMAVFYSVGMFLFGLDLALPIGLFTGLAMFVPYLGFGFGPDPGHSGGPFAVCVDQGRGDGGRGVWHRAGD